MFQNFSTFVATVLEGLVPTVVATAGGIALATVLAFAAGLALLSGSRTLRFVVRVYVEGLRGTSEVVQLFWVFFALPVLVGYQLVPLWAGVLVLGLNFGAYGAEIVRGAVQAVSTEQYEGAIALNFSPRQRMLRVILPQALVEMVPPFNNLFIQLLKGSALLSFIFVDGLTTQGRERLIPLYPQDFTILMIVLVAYLVLSLTITFVMRLVERAAGQHVGRAPSRRARRAAEKVGTT